MCVCVEGGFVEGIRRREKFFLQMRNDREV
jgi:hypothetical protein